MRFSSFLAVCLFFLGIVLSFWSGSMAKAGPMSEPGKVLHTAPRGLVYLYEVCTGNVGDTACRDDAGRSAAALAHWIRARDTVALEFEQLLETARSDSPGHQGTDHPWMTVLWHGHDVLGFEFDPVLPILDIGLDTMLLARVDPAGGRGGESSRKVN